MMDSQFDEFARGRLGNHEVPVPAALWDKLADQQFDTFVSDKLQNTEAPVPGELWDNIAGTPFDDFVSNTLGSATAPVPESVWDKIADSQFDHFVSGKLSAFEAPVPTGLWGKIMPDQDDDTGGFAWLKPPARALSYLALLIGLLGGAYYWFTSSQSNTENTTATKAIHETASNNSQHNTTGDAFSKTDRTGTQTPDANNSTKNYFNNIPPTKNPVHNSAVNDATETPVNQLQSNRTHALIPDADNRKRSTKGYTPLPVQKTNFTSQALTPDHPLLQNNNATTGNANTETEILSDFAFTEPYQTNHLIATPIPFSSKEIGMINKTLSPNHANRYKNVIICPTDKSRNTDWLVEAFGSPDIAFRSQSSNTASQQYMARKDSSENMRPGFTAGIRLVKPITDNISLKAGIQYTQMNQRYVYRTENEVKTITVVSQRSIIRAPGDTVVIMDTSVVQQIGFKNNTVMNRFRSLDIPMIAGYQFGNKESDIRVGIHAGVILNISSWYQGLMLDSSLASVSIPQKGSSNMIYKNRAGLSLYGGISISKKISDYLEVFAEPYFRYSLSNMTTPDAAYNQKISLGGIALGVRLNLNKQ